MNGKLFVSVVGWRRLSPEVETRDSDPALPTSGHKSLGKTIISLQRLNGRYGTARWELRQGKSCCDQLGFKSNTDLVLRIQNTT